MPDRFVVAAVSAYFPSPSFVSTIDQLSDQVDAVVVVDDGSHTVQGMSFPSADVHVIALPANAGIATALNIAVGRARELGASHIVTLDQDSVLEPAHVTRLVDALEEAIGRGEGVVSAAPGFVGDGPVLRAADGSGFDPVQSGQVYRAETFGQLGAFREDLVIDAVDSEYTARARSQGLRVLVRDDVRMRHGLGQLEPVRLWGRVVRIGSRRFHFHYHSPLRTYYMVRNSVWLTRQLGRSQRDWSRRRNRKLAEMVLPCLVFPFDRFAQCQAAWSGWRDGRRARLGLISPPLRARIMRRG